METNHHQNSPPQHIFVQPGQIFEDTPDENRFMKKVKSGPMLPLATAGFLGIAGYRIYKARERGGMKLSFFLIHTRLAAQGFAVAALGSIVLWSLGKRFYNWSTGQPQLITDNDSSSN
ncbi:HIG1 domain member 1A, mitochondrial [Dermatophagoides pteronyssinus]|uniref:HIG1 domain member 1A, mitochondrial n=1 Tax=Dermatophagoides pteronyssinus TaxID=6956 RepID=A0ABQ8J9X7_DERPT|nr:HIG1 domain member 1A, mitochondrial [Dermatophagoides pteronyssinus]